MSHCLRDLFAQFEFGPETSWLEFAQHVLVCARRVRARLAGTTQHCGLSSPEIEMLWACAKAPARGFSQQELADALVVSPAHVSNIVERLRSVGLLQCTVAVGDRRVRLWRLTPAGQAQWHALIHAAAQQGEAA